MARRATAPDTRASTYNGAFRTSSKTSGISTTAVAMRLIIGIGSHYGARCAYRKSGVALIAGSGRTALGLDGRGRPSPHEPPRSSALCLEVRPLRRRVLRSMAVLPQPAVAAVALLIFFDALKQLNAAEIGPQRLRHINLRIGKLPEQKVTQPHLAAGANY